MKLWEKECKEVIMGNQEIPKCLRIKKLPRKMKKKYKQLTQVIREDIEKAKPIIVNEDLIFTEL